MLICVDEAYIRKIAVEANEMVSMGLKLPTSLVSTAPEEFQPQVPTGKLSKTKKKKLKKKAKLQNELIRMQMEHLQQVVTEDSQQPAESEENKGTKEIEGGADAQVDEHISVSATISNNDESPTDNETSASHILNGSIKSNASSENENEDKDRVKEKAANMNNSVKSNEEESNEDNEDVDDNKMSNSTPSDCVIDESKVVPAIHTTPPLENGLSDHSKRSPKAASTSDPTFEVCDFDVKIADLGNACWVDKHFTEGKFNDRQSCMSETDSSFFARYSNATIPLAGSHHRGRLRHLRRHLEHRLHGFRARHRRLPLRAARRRKLRPRR